jgi:quinol-cytochrome oxidoreductase complex cytochrome b subunit
MFLTNMLVLGWLGGLAVNEINQIFMQISTLYYFSYFLLAIAVFILIEKRIFLLISKNLFAVEVKREQ